MQVYEYKTYTTVEQQIMEVLAAKSEMAMLFLRFADRWLLPGGGPRRKMLVHFAMLDGDDDA